MDWFKNDELFFAELDKGHQYALRVGSLLLREGLPVRVPRSIKREDISQRGKFSDEKDLWVGESFIEIKSRNLDFTSPIDYPYPTAFVDTVGGWNAKTVKPCAVVLISQLTGAPVVVSVKNWLSDWTVHTTTDRRRNIQTTSYMVERTKLRQWEDFTRWLCSKEAGEE